MKSKIKFVYFDVGGVVVLDFSKTNKWQEMLDDLKIPKNLQDGLSDLFDRYEPDICRGKKSLDDFLDQAKKEFNIILPADFSFQDDMISRFTKNQSLWPILEKLSEVYQLGLLTNMYPNMLDILKAKYFPKVSWQIEIDSSKVGLAKPDKEIYHLAQTKTGLRPNQILFIDNTAKNLDYPQTLGWQTLLYDPSQPDLSNREITELLI